MPANVDKSSQEEPRLMRLVQCRHLYRQTAVLTSRGVFVITSTQDFAERLKSCSEPPLIIAEAADAHYGDLERAKEMALAAKGAGADVVKFQHHIPEEEMLPDIPRSSNMIEPLWDFLKRNAFTISQHAELSAYCSEIGITYACTPFSLAAAQELEKEVQPLFYKIGSGEMLDFPTLSAIAAFGRPMIISTGMSTVQEIDEMYELMVRLTDTLVLLNCTSAYPPRSEDMHLSFIAEMKQRYPEAIVGHSEHTRENHYSIAAITLGARVIERHVTIDPTLKGPDAEVSLSFPELGEFVKQARELSTALNTEKTIQAREWEIREWAHRSLVYLKDLDAGHRITQGDVWGKRPGTGIPSRFLPQYLGKRLTSPVKANTLVHDGDFQNGISL